MWVSGRIVTPTGVVPGRLRVAGETITDLEPGPPGDGSWVAPGFVDLHNHGGAGHGFDAGDPDAARAAAAFHLAHGTTTLLASLVSAAHEQTRAAVAALAPLVAGDVLAGVHLEGPYLAAARCGAQRPDRLREPSVAELDQLCASGVVRMVTIAPELPGALAAIRMLVARGVLAAVGHTDATYEQTLAAVAAGTTVATHLFNGMPAIHHRSPGPVPALLGADDVVCELIPDGVHLHDGMLRFAVGAAGPRRIALVTDAMAAAGRPDGRYDLGGQPVVVTDGVARLARDGALAGSTLTMDAAVRRATAAGVSIVATCRMAATTPARVLGLGDRLGALSPGLRADLVVLDDGLRISRVMRAGRWTR